MSRNGMWSITVFAAIACAAAGLSSGCGGDDAGGSKSSGDSSENGGSGSGGSATAQSSPSSTGSGSGQCAGMVDMSDACEVCASTMCTAEALACCEQQLEAESMGKKGCLDIVDCGREKMCSGTDCLDADKCGSVIEEATLDVALKYAQPLGDCVTAKCSTCMGAGGAGGGG